MAIFKNREEAGKKLAKLLEKFKNDKDAVIYALPRGGVPIAKIISKELIIPFDLLIVRKIGHPLNPEFAIGALAEDGALVSNPLSMEDIDSDWLAIEIENQKKEIKRRLELYFKGRGRIDPKNKTAILVDDGIATGATILAAIDLLKSKKASQIIVATPIVDKNIAQMIEGLGARVIAVQIPDNFQGAVGVYYENFPQISDEEVVNLLND